MRILKISLCVLVGFAASVAAEAHRAEKTLDEYLDTSLQAVRAGDGLSLVETSRYWISKHSKYPQAIRFLRLHDPDGWTYTNQRSAGDYMSVEVHFQSKNWTHPWQTRFELLKKKDQWLITDFEDLTIRPLTHEPDTPEAIGAIVDRYLETALAGVALSEERGTEAGTKRILEFYNSGAGFWNTPLQSKMFFLWLKQNRPATLPTARVDWIKGEVASVAVTLRGSGRRNSQTTFRFALEKDQRRKHRWFIRDYEDVALKHHQDTLAPAAQDPQWGVREIEVEQSSSHTVVRSQLAILSASKEVTLQVAVMTEIIRKSRPLWADTKRARASLGRLIAMHSTLSSKSHMQWQLATEPSAQDADIVVATPSPASTLFNGIRFTVAGSGGQWLIQSAALFR